MKIIAFGASNSKHSINKALATFAASLVKGAEVDVLDLNDYAMPLMSVDFEEQFGQPEQAHAFLEKIGSADALVISFAENNSSFSVAYKNVQDWCSRIDPKLFQGKPAVFLSTSPGQRGGMSVLEHALTILPRFNVEVKGSMSFPSFGDNFDMDSQTVTNAELLDQLKTVMATLS